MADVDNLKIAQDINKALADRRTMLQAQTREMQSQLQLALQLKAVLDGAKSGELVERLDEAQKALDAVAQKAQDAGGAANQAMAGIAAGVNKSTGSTTKLNAQMKLLVAKYPSLKTVGTAALTGLSQGMTNLLALGKSVGGAVEGIVSGMFNIGKAIISIPLNIFKNLLDTAANFSGDTSLAEAFEALRKEFGSFKEDISNNVIKGFHEIQKGFTGTGLSAMRVLGPLANQLKYLTEIAEGAGAQMHQFGKELADNAGLIAGLDKGLGVGKDNIKAYADLATVKGQSLTKTLKDTANYSLQMGDAFGMSQKVLAKDISMMLKDVKNFGSLTQKEMSVATVFTRKLGLEVKNLLGLIDKFDTFEDAANSAAQLSQAFGGSVDAFKLMQEQDPAKRLDMLRQAMTAAGKSTENMSRQELKLLEQTTGLDAASAKLAFSQKNQGLSYDQVRKQSEKAEKKQLSQAEAMSKLADSIERFIGQGQQLKGSFFDMFIHGFELGVKYSKPFMTLMTNLRRALWDTMEAGRQVGQAFVAAFPGVDKMLTRLASMFAADKFSPLLKKVASSFKQFFADLDAGKLIENLQKGFYEWFGVNSAAGKSFLGGIKDFFGAISKAVASGIKWLVPKLTSMFQDLTEFITNPKKYLEAAKSKGKAGQGFMMEILDPIIKVVEDKDMWKGLWKAFKNFAGEFWKLLLEEAIKPMLKSLPADFWVTVGLIMFGPAATRALVSVGMELLVKAINKTFTQAAEKAIADKAAEAAVKKMTETVLSKGAEAGAESVGPSMSQGIWSKLMPFITTVPSGAAMAGAAAWGAALAVIAAAAVAAYSIWDAKEMQEKAVQDYTSGMSQITNALSKQAPLEEKKRALALRDAQIKAQEDALKDKKSGVLSGALDSFREAWEIALNDTHTTTEDMIAKMKRDRDDLNSQITKINGEAAKKAENDANKKRILDAMGPVTVENAVERFKKLDDLAKKVMSSDFNLGDRLKSIREKLSSVDFSLFKDKVKEDQVNQTLSTLESIKALVGTITDIGALSSKAQAATKQMETLQGTMTQFATLIAGVTPIVEGSVRTSVEKLAGTADVIAKKAQSINTLSDVFKALDDASGYMKQMLKSSITPEQRTMVTTSILGLVTSANVILGDIGLLSASNTETQVTKLTSFGKLFESLLDITRSFSDAQKAMTSLAANNNVGVMVKSINDFASIGVATSKIAEGDIKSALNVTRGIIKSVQDLNDVLASGDATKIKMTESLKKFADNSGLGKEGSFKIENKGITMNVSFEVVVNAADMEEALVLRNSSLIKDGIKGTLTPEENNKLSPYLR